MKTLFKLHRRPRIAIFDWSNVVARAFSVRPDDGLSMLCKMLRTYRKKLPGWRFVFCLEGSGVDQRRKIFTRYKLHREGDGPTRKHPDTVTLLRCITGTVVQAAKGEADDAIASYIRQHCQDVGKVLIISEDRDLWQLIERRVHILTRKGEIDAEDCQRLLGVPPSHVRILKSLTGDSSDGLPRVPRAKTATLKRVAQECSSIAEMDALLEDDETWIPEADLNRMIRFHGQVVCNWKVVGLRSKLKLSIKEIDETATTLIEFMRTKGVKLDPRDAKLIAEQR